MASLYPSSNVYTNDNETYSNKKIKYLIRITTIIVVTKQIIPDDNSNDKGTKNI